jgi:Tfp pilus assembly protein PilF
MSLQQSSPARHPDFIRTVLDRAVHFINDGQLNSADVLLEALADETTVREQVAYLRGVTASGLGKKNFAQHFFKTALEANPRNAHAHALLGETLLDDQPAHAAAALAAALTLDPTKPDWNVWLAKAFNRLGFTDFAKNSLKDALALSTSHTDALYEMDALAAQETSEDLRQSLSHKAHSRDQSVLCEALLLEATRHQSNHDLDRARKLFKSLLEINPSHHLAICNSAILERGAGQLGLAKELLNRARVLLDQVPVSRLEALSGRLVMAEAYITFGDTERARSQIDAVVKLAPEDEGILAASAMALQKIGQSRDAIVHFERAITLNQNQSPEFYCALGAALLAIEMPDRAEITFNHAAALAPGFKLAIRGLFETYLALGRRTDAKAQLDLMLVADPSDPETEDLRRRLAR